MNAYTADNLLAIWTDLNNVNLSSATAGFLDMYDKFGDQVRSVIRQAISRNKDRTLHYLALAGNHVNAGSDNMTKYSLEKIYEIAEHGDTEP